MGRTRRRKLSPGKPLGFTPTPEEIIRFLGKVELAAPPAGMDTPCWVWTAGADENGYGFFKVRGKKVWAHRFSREAFRGVVPEGLDVDHACHVTGCVSPWHVGVETRQENSRQQTRAKRVRELIPF